jgi:5-methyltetrahydropteroyltriglutamate--homocysteine methyltransferase
MRRSTDRILTTHVGALERPPELAKTLAEQGQWAPAALGQLTAEVANVVKRQLETGLDVIDDGEFGKTMWSQYVRDRLNGLDNRPRALVTDQVAQGRDRERFPGFYAWADASKTLFGYMEDRCLMLSKRVRALVHQAASPCGGAVPVLPTSRAGLTIHRLLR